MFVVPVAAPILTAVPAPARLTVVAVPFTKLNVVAVVVKSPPLTATSPVTFKFVPMLTVPPIPTPPVTINAPSVVVVLAVAIGTVNLVLFKPTTFTLPVPAASSA